MTLDELIIQCKKHDSKAQGELYNRYNSILFAICLRYSPNFVEAEDNLQDAFLTIFKKIEQYNGKGSFEGWIKRVTVNTVLQKYRKQRTFEIVDEGQIEDEEDLIIEEEEIPLQFLLKIIQELPDRYRLVFSMYVMDGYQHKEIAEMLGISDGTSKSNLARARAILKNKIEAFNASRNT
ncbi:RNA polymerase sigma factor [Aequorivita viscosa]|uniref:RNA polymerase sigma-70 factor, ECF subfamily n=1 Tax=Aequorivita viscosa TaxID=797419 RepID=A0A1M6DP22_9FLAO|nr:sigma-70 family RNA polymerase sigma factor [Aequorivita viscosa]SDW50750.1 RNA polymerase sigma-70 factor, ECF subfamily [Aequorivita viscosa]SHI74738.1 RNA polymerase sigma-70 factor, ECF subfamily [Aequorivita viscosa]